MTTIVLLAVTACSDNHHDSHADAPEALRSLNATIARSSHYLKQKEERLDSIKQGGASAATDYELWKAWVLLSESYRQMDVDSAIFYARRAQALSSQLHDSVNTLRADLASVDALATAGIFPPALHRLDSIEHIIRTPEEKVGYWMTARRCYSYIMTWAGNNEYYVNLYRARYRECDDSLLRYLPEENTFHRFIFSERLVDEHRWTEAMSSLESLLKALPQDSNLYGMAAYQLATVYRNKGDFRNYTKYLAVASESDIRGCVREGLALPTLANWMYLHGDIDNAFRYVNHTLEDANSGNIRMHTTAIAPIIPLIDSAIHRRAVTSRNHMMAYIIVTTLLFLATIALLIFTFSSLRKNRISQEKLAQTSKKLESYVGNFIGLCSSYASRLEQLSKLVTRKIASGQSDELMKLVSTGKFAEGDNQEFYRLIDKALLDIFPDFVAQINTLLLPDQRIEIVPGEPLPPELRIYAFVRLGVEQSGRIAQILGYSVNTVYAYRNRMRNRASDRENFDRQVAEMGENLSYIHI